jgi:hypothetical protein
MSLEPAETTVAEVADEDVQTTQKPAMSKMTPRVDKIIRKAFKSRVSPGSAVYATAAIEAVLSSAVSAAEKRRSGMKKAPVRIDRLMLMAAVRNDADLSKLLRGYVFSSNAHIRFNSDLLLTKSDREEAIQKRKRIAEEKHAKCDVPSIDAD